MSHQRWCRSVQLVSFEYNVLCLETFVMYHMIMYFTAVTCKRDKTQNVHVSHIIHCIIVNQIMMTEELDEVEFKAVDITGRTQENTKLAWHAWIRSVLNSQNRTHFTCSSSPLLSIHHSWHMHTSPATLHTTVGCNVSHPSTQQSMQIRHTQKSSNIHVQL